MQQTHLLLLLLHPLMQLKKKKKKKEKKMSVGPSTIFLSHNLSVIRNNVVKIKKKKYKTEKTGAVHWWSLKSHRLVALFFLFFCGHRNFLCDSLIEYAHKTPDSFPLMALAIRNSLECHLASEGHDGH